MKSLVKKMKEVAGAVTALAAVSATVSVAALMPSAAAAQAYPTKTIRIIVPFSPGGSTDMLARQIGEKLAAKWGQPVIVENRPGAGGAVGADYVAKSAPDGYTPYALTYLKLDGLSHLAA